MVKIFEKVSKIAISYQLLIANYLFKNKKSKTGRTHFVMQASWPFFAYLKKKRRFSIVFWI